MTYTENFPKALAYAAEAHKTQMRKGSAVPYISHLLGVTAIVLDAGGNETEAIAAVLHDVVEDQELGDGGGRERLRDVEAKFGSHVAAIVEALSDWISSYTGEPKSSVPYDERKAAYREHLRNEKDPAVLLVSAADKLHNARSMVSDFDVADGDLWKRFKGSPHQIFSNFDELIAIYRGSVPDPRRVAITKLLAESVARLKAKSGFVESKAPHGPA